MPSSAAGGASGCPRRLDATPQRPRSHVLGDEGERAFRDALPSEWVFRKVDPDYAIDWTVEIFESGHAVGRSFHAQVKGTDEDDLQKALGSVRFARDTADYYREQTNPVLIVRYHAPTERVFARWFHAYNPRIARSGLNPDAKSIGFQLYEQDEAGDDFADRLRAGLEGFLKFRSARLALPLAVAISPTRPGTWPDARRAALAMRRVLAPVNDLAAVAVRVPAPDEPSITIEPERVIISLADVASVTLDRHRASDDLSDDEHAADLILALAVALTYVGQANLAAQLAAAVAHLSTVIVDVEVTMTVAAAMFQSQRTSEAIKLADNLDESEDPEVQAAAFMLLTVLLGKRGRLHPVERDAALESAERRIERRRAREDDEGIAAEAYNLAMLHKRVQQGGEAVRWFREAAEKDPTYLERDYYHGDMAGALFESGDYEGAAEHYERALKLGGRGLDRALLADSLLYSGRYEEARDKLDAYVADTPGRDAAEWRLKARAVRLLIDAVGSEQKRDERAAAALLDAWSFEEGPDMSIEEAKESCRTAIARDACCGQAWFRLGLLAIGPDAEDPTAGSAASIAGAVLARHDISHWHNAVLCMDPSDTETVSDVFYSGYNLNKENFVNAIVAAIDAAPHLAEHRERLIALLDETVAAYEREQGSDVIMRFRGEDSQMTEIVLSAADDAHTGETDQKEVKWLPPPPDRARSGSKSPKRARPKKPPKSHGKTKRRRKKRR